ncbi:hypothetical protein LJB90_01515 [Eubacteriales bacterium OttesenSCG-928-G02]|nr:hypothetical protein [Eubacteriales bacterium OttesenSCG-928-G02]
MKKTKFYIGIALTVQAVTCFILFLIFIGKKKSLAQAFAAIAAAGGIAGAFLLITSKDEYCSSCCDDYDEYYNDFEDEDLIDDEIFCDFEEDSSADDAEPIAE